MPRWEVHLSFGMMAFIVILSAAMLGLDIVSISSFDSDLIAAAGSVLLLGGGAMILGSVVPDMDGNGKIRWIIGPLAGVFAVVPPFALAVKERGLSGGMEYIGSGGSLLFLAATAAAYLLLLVPMKHRGIWHRPGTGLFFGVVWGSYVFLNHLLDPASCVMVGAMATLGYWWHLALDGRSVIDIIPQ
jgi:hypothetical protein